MLEVFLNGQFEYITKKEFTTLYESNKLFVENDTTGQNDYHTGAYLRYIKKDYTNALQYYLKSIEKHNVHAYNDLAFYYYTVEKNYELTKHYYNIAVEHGMGKSMFSLGHYYDNIEDNIEMAKKYYLMACEKNIKEAYESLGDIYNYVDKNTPLAIQYYIKSISLGNEDAIKELENITSHLEMINLFEKNNIQYNCDDPKKNNSLQIYKNKIKYLSRTSECPVCLNDNLLCIPVNCSAHFVCTECYIKIYDKPCPVCRL